jgi:hypothetical protein
MSHHSSTASAPANLTSNKLTQALIKFSEDGRSNASRSRTTTDNLGRQTNSHPRKTSILTKTYQNLSGIINDRTPPPKRHNRQTQRLTSRDDVSSGSETSRHHKHAPSRNRRPSTPRVSSWERSPSPAQHHQRSSHRNKTTAQVHQQEIKPKPTINRHHRCSPQLTRHARDDSSRDVSDTQDRQRQHRRHGQHTEGSETEMLDYDFRPQKQTQRRQTSRFDQPGLAGAMSTLAAGVSYVLQPHLHSEQKTSGALQRARKIYKGTNADVYRMGALTGELISSDDEDLNLPTFKSSLNEKSEKAPTQTVTQVRNLLALGHKSCSSVTEPGLEILIPDLVKYGNDYNFAPSQLKRILDHHLRGTLKQTTDTIIKTAGILRGIENLGKLFYRPQIRQNYAESIRNWKLNITKPVLPQLQELEVWYMTGHKQNKSAQEIELLTKEAALRGVSLGVKAFMDATESHYRYMHSNKSIPIHTFAKRMERALDGSKAIPAARVRSIETNHPSDNVRLSLPQEPIPASHDLQGLTRQMERMSSQLSTLQPAPVNTRSLELNHLTNSVTQMFQEIAAIRKVTSNLPSVTQMSQEIAVIRNVTSNLPVVNNPKTNYQTNDTLRPIPERDNSKKL